MKYIGHRVHSGSGVAVELRFLQRSRIGDSRVRDNELVAAVQGCAAAWWLKPNALFPPTYDAPQLQPGPGADGVAFTSRSGPIEFVF
jgi:hypothetical protein